MNLKESRVAIVTKTNIGANWLVPFATELLRSADEVTAFLPPGPGTLDQRLTGAGVQVVRSEALSGNPLKAIKGLPSIRRQLKHYDLVNYFLYRAAIVVRVATLGTQMTRVFSVPGPLFYESRPVRLLERLLRRQDTAIFAGSQATANYALKIGYHPDVIRIVPFGADFTKFLPSETSHLGELKHSIGLDPNAPTFIMAAYWYGRKWLSLRGGDLKGHDTLLKAWTSYKLLGGTGQLLIVGGGFGPRGRRYREKILRKCAPDLDSVFFIDTVDNVRDYYEISDISISPSRSENYGSIPEASGMKIPSIASQAGGLPEVVRDGSTGWTFPAGNVSRLALLLKEAECAVKSGLASEMGENARSVLENVLDWSNIVASYVDGLEATLSRLSEPSH